MKNARVRTVLLFLILDGFIVCSCKSPAKNDEPTTENKNTIPAGVFFDDFNYESNADPALTKAGWTIRSGGGGPGPAGCRWDTELISFTADTTQTDNQLLALSAWTQGSGASCHQAEIFSPVQYDRGTFAARVLFTDKPDYGSDGDGLAQTFFTISPWALAEKDEYCEFDFEYLPNGGWGRTGPHLWETSWEKVSDHKSDQQQGSHAGTWQTLLLQADTSESRYSVNDELRISHSQPYVVDGQMSINFNHWFIAEQLRSQDKTKRQYTYYVDWVLAFVDSMITPADVDSLVTQFRLNGRKFIDSTRL